MKKTIWLSIGETTISCTLAIILSGIIFIIQEKLEVIKLLNMDFELIQCLIILIMSVLTILFSAIMSAVVIHENTPVDMLRKVK